jgi:dTDP-L-rhamnose 4-epimerase
LRVLVTGGAGFIGRYLTRALLIAGHDVVALDNLHPQVHHPSDDVREPGVELVNGDVRDRGVVGRVMRGVDVVHHLAGETGVGQSQYEIVGYVSTNTLGTATVLQCAIENKVQQVTIASSRAVYGEGRYECPSCRETFVGASRSTADMDRGNWNVRCPRCAAEAEPRATPETAAPSPVSIYGVTKLQQEQLALAVSRARGLPVTILRMFNVFGPGQSLRNPYVGVLGAFFRRIRRDEALDLYEDGAMLRDFVYVDHAVDVFVRSTGNEGVFGETLNVASGESATLSAIAREVAKLMRANPEMNMSGRYRVGDIRHSIADVTRLRAVLDTGPPTHFADGLSNFLTWAQGGAADAHDDDAEMELAARNLLRTARR